MNRFMRFGRDLSHQTPYEWDFFAHDRDLSTRGSPAVENWRYS